MSCRKLKMNLQTVLHLTSLYYKATEFHLWINQDLRTLIPTWYLLSVMNFHLVPFALRSSLKTEILTWRQCIEAIAWRCKKGVLRNFAKVTGKHLYLYTWVSFAKVTGKHLHLYTWVSFFNKVTLPVAASKCTFYCKRTNSA